MKRRERSGELRCFCSREPLLATYGVDEKGRAYIHQKVYKQSRIYGESIVVGGEVSIRCRECKRWHRVVIRSANKAELKEDNTPKPIDGDDPGNDCAAHTTHSKVPES